MNEQQAETFIAPSYLDDFKTVAKEIIKGEDILWVGNIAQFHIPSGLARNPFGYLVITQERIIRVLFDAEDEGGGLGEILGLFFMPIIFPVLLIGLLFSGKDKEPTFGKIRAFDPKKKRQQITALNSNHQGHSHGSSVKVAPTTPLTHKETASRVVRVFPITNLTNLDWFESQDDHTGEKIVELDIRFIPNETMEVVFYKEQDAKFAYDILLSRLQSNAKSVQQISAISEQLEKLAELHN